MGVIVTEHQSLYLFEAGATEAVGVPEAEEGEGAAELALELFPEPEPDSAALF